MRYMNLIAVVGLGLLVFSTLAFANVSTTTMTWFVASVKTLSVSYGAPCTSSAFFFNETNGQWDPDSDGNGSRAVPQATRIGAGDTNCQSSSTASMVVSNAGTASINVDANFTTAMSATDVNLELKVWQGSAGCGTNGLGGYEEPCSVVTVTSAPNTTTCREFSSGSTNAATAGQRVITGLAVYGSTQLCYAGDFNTYVSSGDHNKSYQLGSEFS